MSIAVDQRTPGSQPRMIVVFTLPLDNTASLALLNIPSSPLLAAILMRQSASLSESAPKTLSLKIRRQGVKVAFVRPKRFCQGHATEELHNVVRTALQ